MMIESVEVRFMNNIIENKNKGKIMTYPFNGLDYENISEIGKKVRIIKDDSGYGVFYLTCYNDPRFGMRQEKRVVIDDENLKSILYYFKFLNDMCRARNISDRSYSYNIYIDTILISINEIVSDCKVRNTMPDYNELLARFGKQFDPNDLFRLYSGASEYEYLNELFEFLKDDSFSDCINGNISDIVTDIVRNKDDTEFFRSFKETVYGPQLIKVLPNKAI